MKTKIRMCQEFTYVTLWGPIALNLLIPWMRKHNIEFEILLGDRAEIPDGVQQFWEFNGRKDYKHAVCIKSHCNQDDLKALATEMYEKRTVKEL